VKVRRDGRIGGDAGEVSLPWFRITRWAFPEGVVALLFVLACSVFQPLDGTWLFQVDPNASFGGDCADDDSGGGVATALGTSNSWVDIYTVSGNQIAILYGDALLGTLNGSAVEASYESGYTYKKRSESRTVTLEATLTGGTLEGTISQTETVTDDGDKYTCTTERAFTAVRSVSSPDTFAGN
jgi:hypothetical protein